jgi:sec-independent protein translocase protein TatA
MLAEIASPDIILIVAVVVLFMFGGSKIPELARSLGKAKKEFEEGSKEGVSTDEDAAAPNPPAEPAAPAAPVAPAASEPQLPPAAGDESSTTS